MAPASLFPAYLHSDLWGIDFAVNYKDFSLREASVSLALIGFQSAVSAGVLFGGFVGGPACSGVSTSAASSLSSPPHFFSPRSSVLLAIQSDEQRTPVLAALALCIAFFMSWYHGPVTAVLHDMMPRRAHATSIGVYMFVTQLVGGSSSASWSAEFPTFVICSRFGICRLR